MIVSPANCRASGDWDLGQSDKAKETRTSFEVGGFGTWFERPDRPRPSVGASAFLTRRIQFGQSGAAQKGWVKLRDMAASAGQIYSCELWLVLGLGPVARIGRDEIPMLIESDQRPADLRR